MRDYLSGLVERNVGGEGPLVPSLEPRINSQYEARSPGVASDTFDIEPSEEADVPHKKPQADNASPAQSAANREPRTAAMGEPAPSPVLPSIKNDAAAQVTASSLLISQRDQIVQRSFEREVIREVIRERSLVENVPTEGLRPLTRQDDRLHEAVRPQALVPERTSSPQDGIVVAPRHQPQWTEAKRPVLKPVVSLEREQPRPVRSGSPSPITHDVSTDTSAQTIQVTIGRLEIRAATALPPPKLREKSVAGPTSLDDYMRKRNGESR